MHARGLLMFMLAFILALLILGCVISTIAQPVDYTQTSG